MYGNLSAVYCKKDVKRDGKAGVARVILDEAARDSVASEILEVCKGLQNLKINIITFFKYFLKGYFSIIVRFISDF
jgi:hypothetical protein